MAGSDQSPYEIDLQTGCIARESNDYEVPSRYKWLDNTEDTAADLAWPSSAPIRRVARTWQRSDRAPRARRRHGSRDCDVLAL